MTSKCKTCGYYEQYHKDHPIISYHKDSYLMEVYCEKFIPEDEVLKKFRPIILKQKKGCGNPHCKTYSGKYLCPSCQNQSPAIASTDPSGDEQIPNGEQNSPSGGQSPQGSSELSKFGKNPIEDTKTLSDKKVEIAWEVHYHEDDIRDKLKDFNEEFKVPTLAIEISAILKLGRNQQDIIEELINKRIDKLNKKHFGEELTQ